MGKSSRIQHSVARQECNPRPGRQNAREVQRVRAGNRDPRVSIGLPPDVAQQPDRVRQSKLFAGESSNETPAADFAAALELAIDAQQRAPWR